LLQEPFRAGFTNIAVRCTFELFNHHSSTNILVLCTFFCPSPSFIIQKAMSFELNWKCEKQQSCKIFIEMYLKILAIGAEHRNI
jgi:hypothetical protein